LENFKKLIFVEKVQQPVIFLKCDKLKNQKEPG